MSFHRNHPDYVDLRSRIRENPKEFIVIAGAGLSRAAGIPLWNDLRNQLVEEARSRRPSEPDYEVQSYDAKLERIESLEELWDAFTDLKSILPKHAYEECIRRRTTRKDRATVPVTYEMLWRLGVKGIVTFNIDTCAIDSYARVHQCSVDSATGNEPSRFTNFLAHPDPFVFQPHGRVEDSDSWVFTKRERDNLLSRPEFITFISTMLRTKHVLILGFDPNDFAFQYLLTRIRDGGPTPRSVRRYLLIADPDGQSLQRYYEDGFVALSYAPSDPLLHPEIADALKDWLRFIPQDDLPGSVFEGPQNDPHQLPSDEELIQMPVDKVRGLLNGAVAAIIPPDTTPDLTATETLQTFYRDHLRAIHMAWLVEPNTECAAIHGYRVGRVVGRGAFGQVYEAESLTTDERVAIKLLLPDVRNDPEYLNSFRRGVRSMRILSKRGISRMVELREAYEVPACIVMDFIDGLTLTVARHEGLLPSIHECLDVLIQVGDTVHAAHNLDERVLHRDLKPDNVLLRNAWSPGDALDVVVLDFDLSWHKGASELSVVHGARAQGYAAPEQTAGGRCSGVTTRHTGVDVFGYGMLAYFIFSGRDPVPNMHRFDSFEENLAGEIRKRYRSRWKCLPGYLAHVIRNCTRHEQGERIGFGDALASFQIAKEMATMDAMRPGNPLILEELAAYVAPERIPVRTNFGRCLKVTGADPSRTFVFELLDQDRRTVVKFSAEKGQAGFDNRNILKYIGTAKEKAVSALGGSGLCSVKGDIGQGSLAVSGVWPLRSTVSRADIVDVAGRLTDAQAEMQLG